MIRSRTNESHPLRAAALTLAVVACACVFAGCQTIQTPFSDWMAKRRDREIDRMANADSVQGPLQRRLTGRKQQESASLSPAAGRDEFAQAERLYKEGKYGEAEKLAKAVAKKYKGSPVREDALFLIAEAQFAQKKYSWAQDSYVKLVKDFPSTRYLERRNKRLFEIARYWLREPEYVTSDDVKLVAHGNGRKENVRVRAQSKSRPFDVTRTIPILPNLWDRSRPVFDTEGRALQALRSIWMSDATGSLADDALMMTASHHLRNRNYLEADHTLSMLREEYPKSPHNKHAHILSGFVKQASYQGPEYDDKVLAAAEQLKQNTLQLYPKDEHAERLRDDLRRINEQKASGDWAMVKYYQRKGKDRSVAIYCREIIRLYPQTKYADMARAALKDLNVSPPPSPKPEDLRKPDWGVKLLPVPKLEAPSLPRVSLPTFGSRRSQPPATNDPQTAPQ